MKVALCTIRRSSVIEKKDPEIADFFTWNTTIPSSVVPDTHINAPIPSPFRVDCGFGSRPMAYVSLRPLVRCIISKQGLDLVRCTPDDTTASHW